MAVLTTKQRHKMPASQFALSGERYPINDVNHARNALARASEEHAKGKLNNSDYHKVVTKAHNFLKAHGGMKSHSDSVKK